MPDDLDLDPLKALIPTVYRDPWHVEYDEPTGQWLVRYRTDNPLAGLVATVPDYGEWLAEFIAAARTAVPALIAEVERLRAQLAQPCGSCHPCTNWPAETWRQAGRHLPDVHRYGEMQDELHQLTAERDRRGGELRRAQAVIGLLSKRIAVLRAEADEEFCTCESYDCHGECCGVGNCTCTTDAEAPVPP